MSLFQLILEPAGIAIAKDTRTLYIAYSNQNKINSVFIEENITSPLKETHFRHKFEIPYPRALEADEKQR